MRKMVISVAIILLIVLIVHVWTRHRHPTTRALTNIPTVDFVAHTFIDARHATMPYRLYSPLHNDPTRRYPLLLFLHGAFERGSDNLAQLDVIGPVVSDAAFRQRFPCYVLAPQCPANNAWVDAHYAGHRFIPSRRPTLSMRQVVELLASLQHQLQIDPERIYVGGNSMGGSGTWDIIARYPHRFAAAFPMCGRGDTVSSAAIVHLPIWAFHNSGDPLVEVHWSRDMIAALRAHGGTPYYSEYPDKSHDCWSRALREPAFFPWLFAQRR
jgi:predicted peptidase